MGEISLSWEKNIVQWGQLAQAIEKVITALEVVHNTEHVQISVFQKLFPQYFLSPGELIRYLEDIRNPASFDTSKPLLEQVWKQAA